jgi:hypothetical protein
MKNKVFELPSNPFCLTVSSDIIAMEIGSSDKEKRDY